MQIWGARGSPVMNARSIKNPKMRLTNVNGCSSENTSEVGKNPFTQRETMIVSITPKILQRKS